MAKNTQEEWLKTNYNESPLEGPPAKRVKLEDVYNDISSAFPQTKFSNKMVSDSIKSAFPQSISKCFGKNYKVHIVGIESKDQPTSFGGDNSAEQLKRERDTNSQLRQKVEALEERVSELEKSNQRSLAGQINALTISSHSACHGPDTISHFDNFTMDQLLKEFEQYAADVLQLLKILGDVQTTGADEVNPIQDAKVVVAMCTLMRSRTRRVLGLQLLISFMLMARSTNCQVINCLNHAGICVSYTTTWKYLKQLTQQSRYTELLRESHWLWVFDNLNIHQKVRHERDDYHSSMLNITSRIAVRIRNLPDWPFEWSDTTPQRSIESLTPSDFLPSEDDAKELKTRAVRYMVRFLVKEFSSLADLRGCIPEETHCPKDPSEVVPMKVLFKDEKYTAETIDILAQLAVDANLTDGAPQVVIGDQATCKTIRASKLWRQTEIRSTDTLKWVNETPGKQWCMHVYTLYRDVHYLE